MWLGVVLCDVIWCVVGVCVLVVVCVFWFLCD